MQLSDAKLVQIQHHWTALADEPVTVELICDNLYAFGSELATLRLFKRFTGNEFIRVGYSENLGTYFFVKPLGIPSPTKEKKNA